MSLSIRPLNADDEKLFPEILELLNRTQGRDLFAPAYIEKRVNNPDSRAFIALKDQDVVAVGIADVISNFDFFLPFEPRLPEILKDKTTGLFTTLCVREDLQGQGIGQQLSTTRLQWLKEKNCDVILGLSWVSGQRHTSKWVFEKFGFYAVKQIDDFYAQQFATRPFICPACGDPPCTCPAILYRLDLN